MTKGRVAWVRKSKMRKYTCRPEASMKRLVFSSLAAAVPALVLGFGAVTLGAQQAPPVPPRATAYATAPDIPFESVPNFLKLPPDLYLGEGIGVARNSKGHVFIFTRSGDSRLFEFDEKAI